MQEIILRFTYIYIVVCFFLSISIRFRSIHFTCCPGAQSPLGHNLRCLKSRHPPAVRSLDLPLAAGGHQGHGLVLRPLAGEEGGDAGVTDILHGNGGWLGIAVLLLQFPHPYNTVEAGHVSVPTLTQVGVEPTSAGCRTIVSVGRPAVYKYEKSYIILFLWQ